MRSIVFHYNPLPGEQKAIEKTFQFDDVTSDKEIDNAFYEWVLDQATSHAMWYEKEQV